ncbi:hypothetical protein MLD38_020690 [Melastoma candidum]|uniref:Uncharacterized protein n=1 Tax=Melastoma candidum TaxID=119954 RepID=A0ACB9QGX0_9MYRT|nr:hypothetical protein MLD38_020690 [Melastoma candidum]
MELPQEIVEIIVSLTGPLDACRVACVSSTFRLAADSDNVWSQFLHSDYLSLKDLYFRLCDGHVLLYGGRSGKKCLMISVRAISFFWVGTPLNWQWISVIESRFPYPVEQSTLQRQSKLQRLELGRMLIDERRAMLREDERKRPRDRNDGWLEMEIGEAFSGSGRREGPRQGEVEMMECSVMTGNVVLSFRG